MKIFAIPPIKNKMALFPTTFPASYERTKPRRFGNANEAGLLWEEIHCDNAWIGFKLIEP